MSKKRRTRRETAAEKRGYRWMMRCLRAADRAWAEGRRSVAVVVHHVGERRFGKGHEAFVAACKPGARHAVAMMRNGSMRVGFTFRKAGSGGDADFERAFPQSHKLVLVMQW